MARRFVLAGDGTWQKVHALTTAVLAALVAMLATLSGLGATSRRLNHISTTDAQACNSTLLSGLFNLSQVVWEEQQRIGFSDGQWVRGTDQPELQLLSCKMHRFSATEARACLAQRPLILLGDSVTRYQYLSLSHFLEFGDFPGTNSNKSLHPGITDLLLKYGDFVRFFQSSTAVFDGRMQCYCWPGVDRSNAREHRFYKSAEGASAVFYWMPGYPDVPLDGLWGFPPFSNSTLSCTPGECDPPDWSLPLPEAIARIMSQLKPHTIVLNHGLWHLISGVPAWSLELHDAVMRAANEAVHPQGGQAIWKTTSYERQGRVLRDFDNVSVEQALAHGWLVMDEWALTFPLTHLNEPHPAFMDDTHFAGYVYRELNQVLLNMVCG